MTKDEAIASLDSRTGFFRHWIGRAQRKALRSLLEGEEAQHFIDVLTKIKARIENMPKTYETERIPPQDKIVYLHYFRGSVDAWIVEKDKGYDDENEEDVMQTQAFGLISLCDRRDTEWSYISIADLIYHGVELDLYFEPTRVADILEITRDDPVF